MARALPFSLWPCSCKTPSCPCDLSMGCSRRFTGPLIQLHKAPPKYKNRAYQPFLRLRHETGYFYHNLLITVSHSLAQLPCGRGGDNCTGSWMPGASFAGDCLGDSLLYGMIPKQITLLLNICINVYFLRRARLCLHFLSFFLPVTSAASNTIFAT